MKRISFTNQTAQKIYDDYFKRVNRCVHMLSPADAAVKEVILGCQMPEAEKDEVIALVKRKFKSAKLYDTRISFHEFKLDLIPIL